MSNYDPDKPSSLEAIAKQWPEALERLDTFLPFHAGAGCSFTTSAIKKRNRGVNSYGLKLRAHLPDDQIEAWRRYVGLGDLLEPEAPPPEYPRDDPRTANPFRVYAWMQWRANLLAGPMDLRHVDRVGHRRVWRHFPQAAQWLTPDKISRDTAGRPAGGDPTSPLAAGIWRRYVTNVVTSPWRTVESPRGGVYMAELGSPYRAVLTYGGIPDELALKTDKLRTNDLPRDQPWWIRVDVVDAYEHRAGFSSPDAVSHGEPGIIDWKVTPPGEIT